MRSKDMNKIVDMLQSDWNFIGSFLNNPASALKKFKLTDEEKRALTVRDAQGLMSLGFEQSTVVAALSGTHSQTCGNG